MNLSSHRKIALKAWLTFPFPPPFPPKCERPYKILTKSMSVWETSAYTKVYKNTFINFRNATKIKVSKICPIMYVPFTSL